MIVETLIKDVAWTKTGVHCDDEKLGKRLYDFLFELILDSHLYVTKIIGFQIENRSGKSRAGTYIARNMQIGESYAEMMNNLQDKVFLDVTTPIIKVDVSCGIVRPADMPCKTLYKRDYICRVLDSECTLVLKLATDCGYKIMEDTSKQLDSKFFPMNTYFNIMDYVRIIPKVNSYKDIELRYYNGMSADTLKSMLVRYMGLIQSMNISEEEEKWVSSFTL